MSDNGIGLSEDQYIKFLAPNFSFKSGHTRGHKGVGATYLAYGFNYIQIATKAGAFSAIGTMKDAKKWLDDPNPAGNPKVEPETGPVFDDWFNEIDQGVSICVQYDSTTYPKSLSWLGISGANNWANILRVKTGLGAIKPNERIQVIITEISKSGEKSNTTLSEISYICISELVSKSKNLTEIQNKYQELFDRQGPDFRIPAKYSNLEAIFDYWEYERLKKELPFSEDQKQLIEEYKPTAIFIYVYSVNVWDKLNEQIGIRKGNNFLYGGLQLAANNMPQGDLIQIPLNKYIGRQNQAHIVLHFENCSADLRRKGFKKEIVDLGKDISRRIIEGPIKKVNKCLKKNTGAAPDLLRQKSISEWKREMEQHEKNSPLELSNENFFKPLNKISITSTPTREQDVIALFNQLIAGGVIRGISIMSTNERSTYDGLYKIAMEKPTLNHLYNKETNPLGVQEEVIDRLIHDDIESFISAPNVLEYKYSLDGLIEDIEDGVKNFNDIGLVVAWEAGSLYKRNFYLESLLLEDNIGLRQYHGVTHRLRDISTDEYICEVILLNDLILYLNHYDKCMEMQEIYDE